MRSLMSDEEGITLIELLGAIVVIGVALPLLAGIFFQIFKIASIQSEKLELQQVSNNMIAKIERLSETEGLYEQAGYLGKYVGVDWKDAHIIKVLGLSDSSQEQMEIDQQSEGTNPIAVTDILDTLNQNATLFHVQNPDIKIKVLQQKNENEITKTIYSTPNYRDTFTIQTTVLIIFYRGDIKFVDFYDETSGLWNYKEIKELSNVVYSREAMFSYRDNSKSKGEIPGDGRW